VSEQTRRLVLELYAEADREVASAGPVCIASGRCCRFKEYGHVLYLSSLEAEVLLHSAPPYDSPVSTDFCPFQQQNLCTARGPRPLGCRVYYCDPSYQQTCNDIMEKYTRRLKELAESEGLEWRYAPLHFFLDHPEEAVPRSATHGEA
jgi:Fe-S-cluster containining protein